MGQSADRQGGQTRSGEKQKKPGDADFSALSRGHRDQADQKVGQATRLSVVVHFAMVGTPRCGVTGRVQRTESRYPLLCLHSVAPLNAARSSQRDDPTLKLQTVPPPACPSLKERKAH